VREPLSARRASLVDLAFALIDKDGSGEVDAREIAGMYDASKHPEVLARRKTATQVRSSRNMHHNNRHNSTQIYYNRHYNRQQYSAYTY
jgi:hypothetical protein